MIRLHNPDKATEDKLYEVGFRLARLGFSEVFEEIKLNGQKFGGNLDENAKMLKRIFSEAFVEIDHPLAQMLEHAFEYVWNNVETDYQHDGSVFGRFTEPVHDPLVYGFCRMLQDEPVADIGAGLNRDHLIYKSLLIRKYIPVDMCYDDAKDVPNLRVSKKEGKGAHFVAGDVLHMPLRDSSVKGVIAIGTFGGLDAIGYKNRRRFVRSAGDFYVEGADYSGVRLYSKSHAHQLFSEMSRVMSPDGLCLISNSRDRQSPFFYTSVAERFFRSVKTIYGSERYVLLCSNLYSTPH